MKGAFIGQGALVQHCADHFLKRGGEIVACCSPDGSMAPWAQARGISHDDTQPRFLERLSGCTRPDVLWSLNNPLILGEPILAVPIRCTVNYHDSPLPKYAGLFATTWAIAARETQHAISYHMVEPGIDTGAILKQVMVDVAPDETAFSLNLKCFQAACAGFEGLLDELLTGRESPRAQPPDGRSYHGHPDRPSPACVLDPCLSAEALGAFIRALDFGETENPVGAAKLVTRDGAGQLCITSVLRAQPQSSEPRQRAEVLAVDASERRIVVGGPHGTWTLSSATPWHDRWPTVGSAWLSPEQIGSTGLTAIQGAASTSERLWVKRFRNASSTQHPRLTNHAPGSGDAARWTQAGATPLGQAYHAVSVKGHHTPADWLALLGAFFGRCNPDSAGHLQVVAAHDAGWQRAGDEQAGGEQSLDKRPLGGTRDLGRPNLSSEQTLRATLGHRRTPLSVTVNEQTTWATVRSQARRFLQHAGEGRLPLWDLQHRYPDLPNLPCGHGVVWVGLQGAAPPSEAPAPGLVVELTPDSGARFAFLRTQPAEQALALVAEFDTFCSTLTTAEPAAIVAQTPLLNADMQQRVLIEWNATDLIRQTPPTICQSFANAVMAHGDAFAISDPNSAHDAQAGPLNMTYAELDASSSAVARALLDRGTEPGDIIGVCIERCAAQLVTVLGVLKARATYLPLDPSYPEDRNRQVASLASPRWVIVRHAGDSSGAIDGFNCAHYDDLLIEGGSSSTALVEVHSSDVAYVIFTSGSTGVPKGVPITHGSLVNHAHSFIDRLKLKPGARILQSASLSFDVAGEQIFPALFSGATVVLRTPQLLESLADLSQFMGTHRITAAILPTGLWQEWVSYLRRSETPVPGDLQVLGVGTEKVQNWALEQWRQMAPTGCRWFQGYGPTETTITCLVHEDDLGAVPERGVPIGRPLPNVKTFVVDQHMQPVPVGFPGELLIAGAGLSPGYLNAEAETRKRFVFTDNLGIPGLRVYRSGDLVVQDEAGRFIFLGRKDNQVKVSGYRVELGEIEECIVQVPHVSAAVVVVAGATKQLIAHVTSLQADPSLDKTVVAHVTAALPAFMVPAAVVRHDQLPTLANGKVDRKRLEQHVPAARQTLDAPKESVRPSSLEYAVRELWKRCLDVTEVGPDDDFFDLGGTSLAAVRLCADIQQELQTRFTLRQVFAHRSLRAMSACLEAEIEHPSRDEPATFVLKPHGGDRAPLFVFCGIFVYHHLARNLPDGRGCIAFSIPEEQQAFASFQQSNAELQTSVESLAATYVEQIRRLRSEGPYHLVGLSAGGVIAHEAARQLTAAGHDVGVVAALDTILPSALTMTVPRRARGILRDIQDYGVTALAERLATKVRPRTTQPTSDEQVWLPQSQTGQSGQDESSDGPDFDKIRFDYGKGRVLALGRMVDDYSRQSRPLRGGASIVFNARKSPWHRHSPVDLGFKTWVGPALRVVELNCDHMDLVNGEEAAIVAAELDRLATKREQTSQQQTSRQQTSRS